jgi:hypothetical protein
MIFTDTGVRDQSLETTGLVHRQPVHSASSERVATRHTQGMLFPSDTGIMKHEGGVRIFW